MVSKVKDGFITKSATFNIYFDPASNPLSNKQVLDWYKKRAKELLPYIMGGSKNPKFSFVRPGVFKITMKVPRKLLTGEFAKADLMTDFEMFVDPDSDGNYLVTTSKGKVGIYGKLL